MPLEIECGSEFGRTVARLEAGTVRVAEVEYEPNTAIPEHYHARPQISLVLAGGYQERYRRWAVRYEPATLIYHAPGHVHADRFADAGGRCLNLSFDAALLERLPDRVADRLADCSRRPVPRWSAFTLRRQLELRDDVTAIDVEAACLSILDDLTENPGLCVCGRPPRWLEAARERVHEAFRDPPSLTELADAAGVHPAHVARAFRRHFGCTVGDYVRQRRIEIAAHLLSDPSVSLSAVAYRAGFADQSHLTRTLKALTGLTPGRFRGRLLK